MVRILLTGGRAPATLDLARQLKQAGHTIFMAESLPWHLSRPSKAITRHFHIPPPRQQFSQFQRALQAIITQEQIDWLIPTCEELFHVARAKPTLPRHCTVFTADVTQLNRLHNKWLFIQACQQHHLQTPETARLTSVADIHRCQEKWGEQWVLKPVYSRFATETMIRPSKTQSFTHLDISPTRPWVGQKFIAGRQICTYSIAHNGRLTLHTAYQTQYTAGQGATVAFQHLTHEAIQKWVQTFVEAEQFTGQIAFDFIEQENGSFYPIECNPRLTSGIHHFSHTPELARAFLDPTHTVLTPQEPTAAAMPLALLGAKASPDTEPRNRWHTLRLSRNIVWDQQDIRPWALQILSIFPLIWLALRHRIPLLEATTHDISWHGEES